MSLIDVLRNLMPLLVEKGLGFGWISYDASALGEEDEFALGPSSEVIDSLGYPDSYAKINMIQSCGKSLFEKITNKINPLWLSL